MVDTRRLLAILDRIEDDLQILDQLAGTSLDDDAVLDRAKYRLVTAIEGLLQAGQHVISSERLESPATYADVFRVLGEAGVLDPDLVDTAQDMARFRNLLVHGYAVVDDSRVADIVREGRQDLRRTAAAIAHTGDNG